MGRGGLRKNDNVSDAGGSGKRFAVDFGCSVNGRDETRRLVLVGIAENVGVTDKAEGFDCRKLFHFAGVVFGGKLNLRGGGVR